MSETVVTPEAPKAARRGRPGSVNRLDPDGTHSAQAEARQAVRQTVRTPLQNGRAVALDREGNPVSRQRDNTIDQFYVPEHLKEPGWDYQWNVKSVLGQESMKDIIRDAENGWTAVPSDRQGFDGRFMPKGWKGAIERDGLVLCERPMALTEEARREDRHNANAMRQQNRDRFGLPELPVGFEDRNDRLGHYGKGKPGVHVGIEGAPASDRNYQIDID
ncbi:MAG TPA: hypothetical protein VI358_18090 [Pseudolabrys sp.]